MKYLTVYLIKGDAGEFQHKMLHELAKKFSIDEAIRRDPPPHLTLKYSFETENIIEIEHMLETFCKKNKPTSLELSGFDHFDNTVIFIKANPSKEMRKMHKELLSEFHKIPWMKWHKHDKEDFNFHASIAHTDIEDKFKEIWQYVQKYTPKYDLLWDNVTLFKLVRGKWKIHTEFRISQR